MKGVAGGYTGEGSLTLDQRARGMGGVNSSCGEENLIDLDTDPRCAQYKACSESEAWTWPCTRRWCTETQPGRWALCSLSCCSLTHVLAGTRGVTSSPTSLWHHDPVAGILLHRSPGSLRLRSGTGPGQRWFDRPSFVGLKVKLCGFAWRSA